MLDDGEGKAHSVIVQVYAFTLVEEAQRAAQLGVDHIGFVAGIYDLVHGELTFAQAENIARSLPRSASSCALTMATDPEEIAAMAEAVRPDIVHLSNDPQTVPADRMVALRDQLPEGTKLMKAIPVQDARSVEAALAFSPYADILLLDSAHPDLPGVGATGQTHDWSLSREIVASVDIPVILAGGLSPENVGEAIRTVRPWGVDSNTATNRAGDPLRKDMARVEAFLRAARSAVEGASGD